MIKRAGYAIRPVQGLALVLLLLASFLTWVVFTSNGEATRTLMTTGHAAQVQLNEDELGQPGSRPLWQAAEDSIYSWALLLASSPRCRSMQSAEWSLEQHASFVPECWLTSFRGGS